MGAHHYLSTIVSRDRPLKRHTRQIRIHNAHTKLEGLHENTNCNQNLKLENTSGENTEWMIQPVKLSNFKMAAIWYQAQAVICPHLHPRLIQQIYEQSKHLFETINLTFQYNCATVSLFQC